MTSDSAHYLELAKGLQSGCGFAAWHNSHCEAPEVLRTPGYPIFIAIVGDKRAILALQAVIGTAVCILVGLFVGTYWTLPAGLASELLVGFDIPTFVNGATLMSDTLFQALVTLTVILQVCVILRRRNDYFANMLILGAAIVSILAFFVRPIGIVLVIFAALPAFFIPIKDWRSTLLVSLITVALPLMAFTAWAARNARAAGVWTVSTDGAIDLYYFKAAGVVWYMDHRSFLAVQTDLADAIGSSIQNYPYTPASLQATMVRRSLEIFVAHPLQTAIMTGRCLAWLAVVPDRGGLNDFLGRHAGASGFLAASAAIGVRVRQLLRSPLLTGLVLFQLLVSCFTWVGIALVFLDIRGKTPEERSVLLILFLLALVILAVAAGAETMARYRVPTVPLLAILAGIGWFGHLEDAAKVSVA